MERGVINNLLIGDDCGLGKTAEAIAIGQALRVTSGDPNWRGLVVHPNKLRNTWIEEIQTWDPEANIWAATDAIPDMSKYSGWWLVSYDQLIRKQLGWLQNWMWNYVVADECHRVKNRTTQRAKILKKIPGARKVGLSGTPMEKDPSDLWSILNWLSPDNYKSFWKFAATYCDTRPNYLGYQIVVGPKNVEQLGAELRKWMIKRTKQQVAPDLPPRIIQRVEVDMTPAQAQAYQTIHKAKDLVVDMQERGIELLLSNALSVIIKLQQVSTFPNSLGLSATSGKIQWVEEFISDHKGEPLLVMSKFRAPILYLRDLHPEADLIVGGETSTGERFKRGETDLLFGTIASMGEGLSLQRARYAIFLDQEWSSIKRNQALDRIHRMNIDEPKLIYELWSTKTDKLVLEAIDTKMTDAELVYKFIETYKEVE